MAIDPKKLAAFAKGKQGSSNLANTLKKNAQKKGGPLVKWAKEEEDEEEHSHDDDEDGGNVDADAIGDRVQNGDGDKRLMKLSQGVSEENNPPDWVEDEDIWDKAVDAVEPRWDEYDQPYAVVTHVYEAMGGGIA